MPPANGLIDVVVMIDTAGVCHGRTAPAADAVGRLDSSARAQLNGESELARSDRVQQLPWSQFDAVKISLGKGPIDER